MANERNPNGPTMTAVDRVKRKLWNDAVKKYLRGRDVSGTGQSVRAVYDRDENGKLILVNGNPVLLRKGYTGGKSPHGRNRATRRRDAAIQRSAMKHGRPVDQEAVKENKVQLRGFDRDRHKPKKRGFIRRMVDKLRRTP